jgi:hypothetical protein
MTPVISGIGGFASGRRLQSGAGWHPLPLFILLEPSDPESSFSGPVNPDLV